MRALEFITGHVIYNPAYTYKFQLKTTIDKKVSTKFLEMILGKGCKFLDISLCETLEETLNFEGRSELRHLDVSNYFPKKQVIEKILRSCHDLEKLAMRNLTLWPNVICDFFKNIGPTLQILNLSNCEGRVSVQGVESL